jgi:hypothetical protein
LRYPPKGNREPDHGYAQRDHEEANAQETITGVVPKGISRQKQHHDGNAI